MNMIYRLTMPFKQMMVKEILETNTKLEGVRKFSNECFIMKLDKSLNNQLSTVNDN